MARLPRNDAPIEGGASLEDNSSIEDIFSGLHLSPAQAWGIVLALLRISNRDSTASAPASVSELTFGIGADDFEVLPPVSEANSFNAIASRPATTDLSNITASPDPSDALDHLLPDDMILVTSRSSPLHPTLASPARPLARRSSVLIGRTYSPAATAPIASPAGIATPASTTVFSPTTTLQADTSLALAELDALTAAVTATTLDSDDGEEDSENGVPYHVPASTQIGPFYVVTRGLQIGIFAGWGNTSPLVTGVSNAVFWRVPSVHEGHIRMQQAIASGFVEQLHK